MGKGSSTEELEKKVEDQELPEYFRLHQMVVRRIGEICRIVNQVGKLWLCFNRVRLMSAEGGRSEKKTTKSNEILRVLFLCSCHFTFTLFYADMFFC